LAPVHTLVDLWQVSHAALVRMCLLDLVVAVVPLWQLAQPVVTETLAWNLAGSQLLPKPVLWQVVQLALVATCLALLPVAVLPLWQLAQSVAAVKLLWSMLLTGNQAIVL
jgi:hypothetical protein